MNTMKYSFFKTKEVLSYVIDSNGFEDIILSETNAFHSDENSMFLSIVHRGRKQTNFYKQKGGMVVAKY